MNFFTTDVDIYQYMSTISQATSLNPPSWQEVPALPAMQPPMMQLPVIWSQGPLQLQWLAQFNPQWVLGQSVDSITIQNESIQCDEDCKVCIFITYEFIYVMGNCVVILMPNPPSWQDIPILPGTQPAVQLPVTGSQSAKQLQGFLQLGPQRLPGQSVGEWLY